MSDRYSYNYSYKCPHGCDLSDSYNYNYKCRYGCGFSDSYSYNYSYKCRYGYSFSDSYRVYVVYDVAFCTSCSYGFSYGSSHSLHSYSCPQPLLSLAYFSLLLAFYPHRWLMILMMTFTTGPVEGGKPSGISVRHLPAPVVLLQQRRRLHEPGVWTIFRAL